VPQPTALCFNVKRFRILERGLVKRGITMEERNYNGIKEWNKWG
jgi:hypothetical protein